MRLENSACPRISVRSDPKITWCAAKSAIAVDMESLWLADAAGERPFVVLRVVLDTPSWELLRPGIVLDSLRALATLRRIAPALETWSDSQLH
jgi:4-hydroxy-3-methylbut-2-enyl diphosphate reductase